MRLREVRNLRRGDTVVLGEPWGNTRFEVVSVDTADYAGFYGVTLAHLPPTETSPKVRAVWPGDDLIELV